MYGLGRVIQPYDMPAVRAIQREAAGLGRALCGDRARHREERAVPDAPGRRYADGHRLGRQTARSLTHRRRRRHPEKLMYITKKHLSRRTVLQGMGAAVALPFLDAMVSAQTPLAKTAAMPKSRLGRHRDGARRRRQHHRRHGQALLVAGQGGHGLRVHPDAEVARAVSRLPHHRQQHRPRQRGRGHAVARKAAITTARRPCSSRRPGRSSPKGPTSAPASRSTSSTRSSTGQDTPIPSIQLCIENVDGTGACGYGYACVYADTVSWAAADKPLPMERDPRTVFEKMFGDGGTVEERRARQQVDRSILDGIVAGDRPAARAASAPSDRAASQQLSRGRARGGTAHPQDRAVQRQRRGAGHSRGARSACPTRSANTSS